MNSNWTLSQHINLIYQEWRVVQKLLWKKNYEVKWLFVTVRNKICSFRSFWFLLKRISFAESAFSLNRMQSVLHFYSSQEKRLFNLDTWLVAFTTFQIEIFLHPTNRSKVNILASIRERKVIQKSVIYHLTWSNLRYFLDPRLCLLSFFYTSCTARLSFLKEKQ